MEILYFQFAASLVIRRPRRAVALLTQCSVFCALVYLLLIFDLFFKNYLNKNIFYSPLRIQAEHNLQKQIAGHTHHHGDGVMARSRSGSTDAGGAA